MRFRTKNRVTARFASRMPAALAAALMLSVAALAAGCGNEPEKVQTLQTDAYPTEAAVKIPPTETTPTKKIPPPATTTALSANISDQTPANVQAVPSPVTPVPDPAKQTVGLLAENVALYVHQGNNYHNLVTDVPVEFGVNIMLWKPVTPTSSETVLINQPTSVYVEYWRSDLRNAMTQKVDLSHFKNDQGHSWWVATVPPLTAGNYEAVAYAVTNENTVTATQSFKISVPTRTP